MTFPFCSQVCKAFVVKEKYCFFSMSNLSAMGHLVISSAAARFAGFGSSRVANLFRTR
jgi:hypothetical protein